MSSPSTPEKSTSSNEPISLPPISEFSTRFRLPVSPPLSNNSNKRVKRDTDNHHHHHPSTLSDPSNSTTLHGLTYRHHPAWDDSTLPQRQVSPPPTPPTDIMSSAQVLAEKRRRNAGASARFRERRKLRERDLQETCKVLDRRVFALESALKQLDPHHSLLASPTSSSSSRSSISYSLSPEPDHPPSSSSPPPSSGRTMDHALIDRVSQLEQLMTLFQQEKTKSV